MVPIIFFVVLSCHEDKFYEERMSRCESFNSTKLSDRPIKMILY